MIYSSRVLALLLALSISVVTTVLFALFDHNVGITTLLVLSCLCFAVSFLLLFTVFEVVVFREASRVQKLINKLKKKEFSKIGKQKEGGPINPFKKINDEIVTFAESKQLEIDELKKLEAFRKEFIADVSHELKTPIFAAQGFLHTLLDGAVNDKNVRLKFLTKAAKSLDGLDTLVQDLLTLSHIETGQIKMHFEQIDLYKLTTEVFEQIESKAEKRDITLEIESSSKKVIVYADWQRITQVMTNLVSNAVKHSNEEGRVIVHFETTKKNVITSVIDHGEGIPPEHQKRIFERFYRVDKSRSREKGGTGLGLAIVKHILDGHQAKAEVTSTPGKGSTFSFKLPRFKDDPED